jgi:ribosomal protein S18 acetylase RimI-like enzyme
MTNRQTAKTQIVLAKPTHGAHLADMSKRLIEQGLPWYNWTPKRMSKSIKRADNVTLLSKMEKKILGFASMQFGDEQAHLNLLAVEDAEQRAGLASGMLNWLEESCQVAGIQDISLECRKINLTAIKFYEKRGFERFEEIPNYYCGTETAVRMQKKLSIAE